MLHKALKALRHTGLVAVAGLCCSTAWAHGGLAGSKSLWGGISHFLTSPLSLAAMVGMLVALFAIPQRASLIATAVAGIAAGIASAFSGDLPVYLAPGAITLVGLCALAGWKPSQAGAVALALVAGVAGGLAADLDAPSLPGGIGVGGVEMFIVGCLLAACHDFAAMTKLQVVMPIARRVVGSWVAAMGLLMTTLAIHLGKS